jgi:S-adenosyl methyltransferase
MSGRIQQQITWRTREQVARFFEGTDLVEPGLVRVEEWRPEPGTSETEGSPLWCAVGRSADSFPWRSAKPRAPIRGLSARGFGLRAGGYERAGTSSPSTVSM